MFHPAIDNNSIEDFQGPLQVSKWVQVFHSETGSVYYYNSLTGVSQWEPPTYEQLYNTADPNLLFAYGAANGINMRYSQNSLLAQQEPMQGRTLSQNFKNSLNKAHQHIGFNDLRKAYEKSYTSYVPYQYNKNGSNMQQAPDFTLEQKGFPIEGSILENQEIGCDETCLQSIDDERCWGRPNREKSSPKSDGPSGLFHRFRSTSSTEPTTIVRLSASYEKSSISVGDCNQAEDGISCGSETPCRDRASTLNGMHRSRVSSTIFQPDAESQLHSVAVVLHAHMISFATSLSWNQVPRSISIFDDQSTSTIDSIPTPELVFKFMNRIYKSAEMIKECIIMSLIYLERLLKASNGALNLHINNWKPITLICMIVASKVWDDLSMQNGDFSKICPDFSVERINNLEAALLEAIEYRVRVPSSSYAKYYFQLRAVGLGLERSHGSNKIRRSKYFVTYDSTLNHISDCNGDYSKRRRRRTFVFGSSPTT